MMKWIEIAIATVGLALSTLGVYKMVVNQPEGWKMVTVGLAIMAFMWMSPKQTKEKENK